MGRVLQRQHAAGPGDGARHRGGRTMMHTVAIGGLGAIGLKLARALDAGVEGLRLVAVAARDPAKAESNLRGFRDPPCLVALDRLAEADIVVEAAPAAVFESIALAAIEAGRVFVPASV